MKRSGTRYTFRTVFADGTSSDYTKRINGAHSPLGEEGYALAFAQWTANGTYPVPVERVEILLPDGYDPDDTWMVVLPQN